MKEKKEVKVIDFQEYQRKKAEKRFNELSDHIMDEIHKLSKD